MAARNDAAKKRKPVLEWEITRGVLETFPTVAVGAAMFSVSKVKTDSLDWIMDDRYAVDRYFRVHVQSKLYKWRQKEPPGVWHFFIPTAQSAERYLFEIESRRNHSVGRLAVTRSLLSVNRTVSRRLMGLLNVCVWFYHDISATPWVACRNSPWRYRSPLIVKNIYLRYQIWRRSQLHFQPHKRPN